MADREYLGWVARQPCMISGKRATVHHVRMCGSPKDDRRVVPLAPEYHMIGWGSSFSVEALGKAKFEARYGVDLEAAIAEYRRRYAEEVGEVVAEDGDAA